MAEMKEKADAQSLKGNFEGIILRRLETGALIVDVSSLEAADVTIITKDNARVTKVTPVEEQTSAPAIIKASVDRQAYNVGDVLPDGWVVGPVSPTTKEPIALEPVSGVLEGYRTWYEGEEHARRLLKEGHAGARLPDLLELENIYNNIVQAGRNQNARFNTSERRMNTKYWSSTSKPNRDYPDLVWTPFFNGGDRAVAPKSCAGAYVRCIRDEPDLKLA